MFYKQRNCLVFFPFDFEVNYDYDISSGAGTAVLPHAGFATVLHCF